MWIVDNIRNSSTWRERLKPNLMYFRSFAFALLFCLLSFFVITPGFIAFEAAFPDTFLSYAGAVLVCVLCGVTSLIVLCAVPPACMHLVSAFCLFFRMVVRDKILLKQRPVILPQFEKKLLQYQKLLDAGIITKAEFNAKRQQLFMQ